METNQSAKEIKAQADLEISLSFPVPAGLKNSCKVSTDQYAEMYRYSIKQPEEFWAEQAALLDWERPWDQVLKFNPLRGEVAWFIGGRLNVCYNCVDRHLPLNSEKVAIIWEGNTPGEVRRLTYRQLHAEVCKFANVLKSKGVKKGDRIAFYMPMVPELAIGMLACARIGAVHSVIFAGFSADAIRDRVTDAHCKIVVTANVGLRGDKIIPLKEVVDRGLKDLEFVEHVLVYQRNETAVEMQAGRDSFWQVEMASASSECACESMDSEDPLFILYTSGSTGKPKGVLHTQAGYLLYTSFTHRYVFDLRPDDIYFCAADLGWVTGHSYIVYGPLANGATTVIFESLPTYPDAGRYWDVVERHKVNIFYTAPTAIRAIAKEGNEFVTKYNRSSLRIIGSVGEPINADAWLWYYKVVGEERCALVDTWWQTETGGILISPLPGATATKPGSATLPLFGIKPVLVDDEGKRIEGNSVSGRLCMEAPWPGLARTVYGNHQRFIDTYFSQIPGMYFTGDAATRDADGYYWISGRVDDVLNVSGHRLGTAEIESALVHSGIIAEAAVVPVPHAVKGSAIYAFCIPKAKIENAAESTKIVKQAVRESLGAFAIPDNIRFVPGLPKTRSGKIMRRILKKIAEGERNLEQLGDITTLAEPAIVTAILEIIRNSDAS